MVAVRVASFAAAIVLAACTAPDEAPSTADDAIATLLAAAPHEWSARLPAVHQLGAAAAPRVQQAIREQPEATGAPAAVGLLGLLGGDGTVPFLMEEVDVRSPLAVDAAQALGALHAAAARDVLAECAGDHAADATLRTAAACALARIGAGATAAPLLRAVLLAGSPAGVAPGREQALPERPRWALERYMVQRMLRAEGATELAEQLDPDAPWPALAEITERVVTWLQRG